ncbi:MAG: PAS domain S-box protein [Candidatus Kapabacteria bacterium]|nr:PAS domain S-box protein [Candidatus Kapabacteria bacterium]
MSKEVLSVCFGREEVEVEDILQRLQPILEATQAPHHKSSSAIRSRKHLLDSENNKIEAERLLHELQVHQVELQAQNEELKTSRSETEEQLLRYTKLYEFAPMGYFTVLRDGAIIQKANLAAERLMGLPRREIINQPFVRFIEEESRVVVYDLLKKAFARATDDEPEGCEVKMLTDENKPFWAHIRTIVSADRQFCRIVVLDIRVIKENEEALRKSEAVFRSALQSLSEGVVVHDAASVIQLCNPQAEQILGLTVEQMKGRTSFDPRWRSVHEDGSPFHGENHPVPITLKTGMSQHNVIMGVHKPDGSLNWISINAEPIIFEGETEIRGAIATFTDITERKRAQEELRMKEQRFRSFVELQGTYFLCTDLAGNYTYASPAHIRTFGMGKTSLIGLNGLQHIIPEDHAKMERTVEQCLQNPGTPVSVVLRKPSTSGEILLTEWECITVTDAKGVVAEIQCIGHDITELKRMEEHYLRSNQLLEASQSIAKVGGWELDIGSSHLYWTAETYRIHDTSPEEFNPTVDAGVGYFLPDSKRQISAALELAMIEGKGYDLTLETYTTKGRHIHVRTTCKVTSIDGKPITLTGIFQDITEQKKSEQVLKDSEQRLGLALEGGNLGLWDWDALTNTLIVNERWLSMLGLNPSTTIPTLDFWHSLVHPEDMPILQNLIDTVISNPNGKRVEAEVRARHANGEYIWILDKGAIVGRDNNGNPLRIVGTHMDITERKTAEKKINLLQQKYLAILNAANGIVWEADAQTFQFTFVSGQAEAILGYPIHRWTEEPTFWKDHIHPEDSTWAVDYCLNCILKNQAHDFEYRMIAADGRVVWLHDIVTVESENGKPVLIRGLMVDITYRKQAEAALENALKRLELATHSANIGIWEYGLNDGSLIWDDQMYALYGITQTTFSGVYEAWQTGLHPEDRERSEHELEIAIAGGKDFDTEFRVVWPDQSIHHIRAFATVIFDAFGKAIKMIGANYDITERKEIINELVRAKEKAEESERRLVIAQGVTKVGSWETDLQTLEVVWSEETYKIFGTDHLSFQASHTAFLEFVHPEDKEKVDKAFLESFTKTGINVVEHRILPVGNSVKYVEERWQIHADLNGKPTRAVGTCQDITERKRAEEKLRKTEENQQRILETMGVGVTVTRNGQVLFANESWCKLIGYTAEEIRSFDFYDIVHPVSRQLIRERGLARMRGKEVPDRYETQFCHKNGTILWIDISAFLIEYEGMTAVISTMVDITDRKRAENLLAASEERYRSFVELQGTYFLRTDLEGKYTYASPAHIQTFGMGQTSLIGRSGLEHIIPEDHEKTFRVIEQCLLKPGTAVSVILRKPSTSGKILWTEWEFITIQDANGAVIEIQCVGHDITDRKIAEQELLNLNQTLEQRVEQRTRELVLLNNEKNEFLGIAAHDLKNPLSGILTSAEILERYYGGEAQTKRYISMIVSASEQMLDIIENLLDVNKIESGLLKVNIIPISLDVVSAVVDDYQQRATNKGIIFCFFPSVDEPAPVVLADEKALWQVLDNLVSNAVKYSPHWKTVNVRVLSRTDEEGNCFGRVEIQDEGPGISETDMHKLFDKFTRLSAQPTGGENSTGLGLSIVKKLVELQQGQVWCESELGKGATFIVEFPCA